MLLRIVQFHKYYSRPLLGVLAVVLVLRSTVFYSNRYLAVILSVLLLGTVLVLYAVTGYLRGGVLYNNLYNSL